MPTWLISHPGAHVQWRLMHLQTAGNCFLRGSNCYASYSASIQIGLQLKDIGTIPVQQAWVVVAHEGGIPSRPVHVEVDKMGAGSKIPPSRRPPRKEKTLFALLAVSEPLVNIDATGSLNLGR
jgi:hypothetical protein